MTRGGGILSIRGGIALRALTAGDGPIMVYLTSKSLTLALLEEYLELNAPVHPEATASIEKESRGKQIRQLGILTPSGNGTVAALLLEDKPMKGLRFSEEAAGWQLAFYNLGKDMTNGSSVNFVLQPFVRWNRGG